MSNNALHKTLMDRLHVGLRVVYLIDDSLGSLDPLERLVDGLSNEELLELSSLIEHRLFERQRKELSSKNTVVDSFDDCF